MITKLKITIALLFLASWAITGYVLYGKGIHITNNYEQKSYQYQNQQQSQILMGMMGAKGHIEWKRADNDAKDFYEKYGPAYEYSHKSNVVTFLNSLSPEQALFTKVWGSHGHCNIYYPVFIEEER